MGVQNERSLTLHNVSNFTLSPLKCALIVAIILNIYQSYLNIWYTCIHHSIDLYCDRQNENQVMLLFLAHRLSDIETYCETFKHSNNKQKIHKDKQSQEIPWEYKKIKGLQNFKIGRSISQLQDSFESIWPI